MSDLIDRNAAIDAVESFDIIDGYTDQQELIYRIRQLPSVMPVRDCKGCRFKFLPERKEEAEIEH